MAFRNSTVKLNMGRMKKLDSAAVKALTETVDTLKTEVKDAQVMPRDTGTMQNESTFVDISEAAQGTVSLVTTTPYVRRLYYHPEYQFHQEPWTDQKGKEHGCNKNAKGRWLEAWMKGGEQEGFCEKVFKQSYKKEANV